MTLRSNLALAALLLALTATPCRAGVGEIVYDPTAYASLVEQAKTALDQLTELRNQIDQAKRLYDGFNQISNVNDLAKVLALPAVRAFVPDIDAYVAAAKGDLSALGPLGEAAAAIRKTERLFTAPVGDALGQDLERNGDEVARDLALGRQAVSVGADRLAGLRQLTAALDGASNARAVMDIQGRLAAEQTMISNDQMRLQGLAMAQAAEQRLRAQREAERAAAASTARIELYRQGFEK